MIKTEHLSDSVTLYLGDSRDVVPTLPRAPALISDPPYGIDYTHSGEHACRFNGVGVTKAARIRGVPPIIGDNGPFDPAPWIAHCENVLLWGADHFYPRLPDRGRFLGWNKLGDMEPWDSFSDIEFAWHSADKAARVFNMKWKGIACDKRGESNGLREHPTQKPIALMKWCIDQAEVPAGAIILDPFMGSGTTGVAAVERGYGFRGVEIDAGYFEISLRRISQALARPRDMFLEKPARAPVVEPMQLPLETTGS